MNERKNKKIVFSCPERDVWHNRHETYYRLNTTTVSSLPPLPFLLFLLWININIPRANKRPARITILEMYTCMDNYIFIWTRVRVLRLNLFGIYSHWEKVANQIPISIKINRLVLAGRVFIPLGFFCLWADVNFCMCRIYNTIYHIV